MGKTEANRKHQRGSSEAVKKAERAHTIPHGVAAYAFTRPLLSAQAPSVSARYAKARFAGPDG